MADPRPDERVYYRNVNTGDRGYLVQRDGKDCIRRDLPAHLEEIAKLDAAWTPDHEHRPITQHSLALVAYAADQQLCRALGLRLTPDWKSLKDTERISFMESGPPGVAFDHARKRCFLAITGSLGYLAK